MTFFLVAFLFLAAPADAVEPDPHMEVLEQYDSIEECMHNQRERTALEHEASRTVYDCIAYSEDV